MITPIRTSSSVVSRKVCVSDIPGGAAVNRLPVKLFLVAFAAVAAAPLPLAAQPPRGEVRFASFFSPALGVEKHFVVYLPPSYARQARRRFPVAYYLHGLTGNEGDWVTLGAIDRVADSLIARGMPEMILVMPDGDDGWYTNWAEERSFAACMADTTVRSRSTTSCTERERYEDYVARDLVGHVDSTYRTQADREHRGIAGLSMGGYGAVVLALKHADVFSAAASHSGVVSPLYAGAHPFAPPATYLTSMDSVRARYRGIWPLLGVAFGADTGSWYARDPARLARRAMLSSRAPAPALFLDVGTEDGLVDQNRAFHWELLTGLGYEHVYAEWPGIHNWPFWHDHVGESLRFLASHIAR